MFSFSDAIDSGYFGYMTEAAGMDNINSSRTTKINAVISDFKNIVKSGGNPNEYIHEVLASHGLNQNLLTDAEIDKINRSVC